MERACEMGDSLSCETLGERATRRPDSKPDFAAGADFYLRACQLGNTRACMKAAAYITDGELDRPGADPVQLNTVSCEAGYATACFFLGSNLLKRNMQQQARAAFERACAMGNDSACYQRSLLDE